MSGAPRAHGRAAYNAVKARCRQLVEALGGFEEAARVTRVGVSTLHDYCNPAKPASYAPADVLLDLESAAGDNLVSRLLAQMALERAGPAGSVPLEAQMLGLASELGDLAREVSEAQADRVVTPAEWRRISRRAESLKQAVHRLTLQAYDGCGGEAGR